ncbi:hypothetical protein P3G55_13850 [Leptospira sp. 96542]|nr:hypothetical protein [Leptospira sp. 96542]
MTEKINKFIFYFFFFVVGSGKTDAYGKFLSIDDMTRISKLNSLQELYSEYEILVGLDNPNEN